MNLPTRVDWLRVGEEGSKAALEAEISPARVDAFDRECLGDD